MPRVLVVDDEPGMRRTLAISLKREGYEVEEATGGTEVLVCLEREIYDLIMTDLKMAPLGDLRGVMSMEDRDRWPGGCAARTPGNAGTPRALEDLQVEGHPA